MIFNIIDNESLIFFIVTIVSGMISTTGTWRM